MKLLLTSFGITEQPAESAKAQKAPSLFYRMPPVSIRSLTNTFMPDYSTLLLCEKLILDEVSFNLLNDEPHPLYEDVAKTFKLLHSEGFIELVDFNSIIGEHQVLFQKMLDNDLTAPEQWLDPLRESVETWMTFTGQAGNLLARVENWETYFPPTRAVASTYEGTHFEEAQLARNMSDVMHIVGSQAGWIPFLASEALKSPKKYKKAKYRKALYESLQSYLSYVNANILLSNKLGVGVHDWADFLPFYRKKYLSVGQEDIETTRHTETLNKLFELSFPEFAITNPSTLIKILQDKRVADLRQLVSDAVEGKVTFDIQFARNVFKEVLQTERRIYWYRNIVSYLTLPLDLLGFLPGVGGVVQKGTEEAIGAVIESSLKKKHRWFYMLSDLSEKK